MESFQQNYKINCSKNYSLFKNGFYLLLVFSLFGPENLLADKKEKTEATAKDQPLLEPEMPLPDNSASETGSLWSDAGYQKFLYYDRKAKTVGDLVTVKIVEASQASRSASTSADRQSDVGLGVSALFGLESSLVKAAPSITPSSLVSASGANTFKGDGATSRSGTLTATITARVMKVLPNGNLMIMGQQEVKINNELQVLVLRGIVRPQDIQINNVILSTYIADAKIEYTGSGVLSDKQKPGWFSRVLDKIWPF